jgi:hypothetical protein
MIRKFEKYKRKTKMSCCKKLTVFGRPLVRGFVKMDLVEGIGMSDRNTDSTLDCGI